jgi:hypothetical protein
MFGQIRSNSNSVYERYVNNIPRTLSFLTCPLDLQSKYLTLRTNQLPLN